MIKLEGEQEMRRMWDEEIMETYSKKWEMKDYHIFYSCYDSYFI